MVTGLLNLTTPCVHVKGKEIGIHREVREVWVVGGGVQCEGGTDKCTCIYVTNPAREEHRNSCTRHEILDVGSKLYIHL